MRPIARLGAVDLGAEKHLGLTARADGAAGLDRRRCAHLLQREVLAVAESYTEGNRVPGRTGAFIDALRSERRRRHAPDSWCWRRKFRILWRRRLLLLRAAKKKIEETLGARCAACRQRYSANQRGEKKCHAPVQCFVATLARHRTTLPPHRFRTDEPCSVQYWGLPAASQGGLNHPAAGKRSISAAPALIRGMSSRPKSTVSLRGSKPRMRNDPTPSR